eukprot:5323078-Lingulodinium_polyedra.AAC.1
MISCASAPVVDSTNGTKPHVNRGGEVRRAPPASGPPRPLHAPARAAHRCGSGSSNRSRSHGGPIGH